MSCVHGKMKHKSFRSYGRRFVEFWHGYFRSTGLHIRDVPIKYYLSAADLVNLQDLCLCTCDDLIEKIFTFECSECRKCFPSEYSLREHTCKYNGKDRTVIKKDRPFECIFCDTSFQTKENLLRHTERHTGDYECKVCNQSLHQFGIKSHNQTKKHLNNVRKMKRKNK